MKPEPQQQHRWLERLVGDWTFDSECNMGPDQPPMQVSGTDRVRSLGGLWVTDDDRRTLTSRVLGPDGQWHQFMQMHYQRTR